MKEIVVQKKVFRIMNFKDQLFHSSPLFSSHNILKFGDKIALENIIFVSKCINRQVLSIFYEWFTFSGNFHRCETCWSVTNYLNTLIFRTKKYGHFSITTSAICFWNYTQDMLKINLSLKNSNLKSIKYFLTKYFMKVSFCRLGHNLHGIYEII